MPEVLDRAEIEVLLTGGGRLAHRQVRLERITMEDSAPNGVKLIGTAVFRSSDVSLQNLLEGVVPAVSVLDAAENMAVVYHLRQEGMIPILRRITFESKLSVVYDRPVEITVILRELRIWQGMPWYKASATLRQDGAVVMEIDAGVYCLMADSQYLLELHAKRSQQAAE